MFSSRFVCTLYVTKTPRDDGESWRNTLLCCLGPSPASLRSTKSNPPPRAGGKTEAEGPIRRSLVCVFGFSFVSWRWRCRFTLENCAPNWPRPRQPPEQRQLSIDMVFPLLGTLHLLLACAVSGLCHCHCRSTAAHFHSALLNESQQQWQHHLFSADAFASWHSSSAPSLTQLD